MGALALHDAAEAFLEAAADALDTLPSESPLLAGTPARRYVSAGTPAIDCDQLVVWAPTIDEDGTLPSGILLETGARGMAGRVNFPQLNVMIVRCIPAVREDRQGRAIIPEATALGAAGMQTNADAWVLWCGINAARKAGRFNDLCSAVSVGRATALTPSGGYGGWQLPIFVQLDGYRVELGS